jgi:hypothetical protein
VARESAAGAATAGRQAAALGETNRALADLAARLRRDAEESVFAAMSEEDLALMRAHGDLLLPQSLADMLAVLQGKGFGREIARWLAFAAVVFFLLESLLARWVSKSRRSAEDVRVEFGENTVWRGGLR